MLLKVSSSVPSARRLVWVGVRLGHRGRLARDEKPERGLTGSVAADQDALGGGGVTSGEARLVEAELGRRVDGHLRAAAGADRDRSDQWQHWHRFRRRLPPNTKIVVAKPDNLLEKLGLAPRDFLDSATASPPGRRAEIAIVEAPHRILAGAGVRVATPMSDDDSPFSNADPEVARAIGKDPAARRRKWIRRIIALAALASASAAGVVYWRTRPEPTPASMYQTVPVERGGLQVIVTATGTLEALNLVEVGCEITGRVLEVNADFNGHVQKDDVLVRIDTAQYDARVDQAEAQLASAYATLKTAKANATETRLVLKRIRGLHENELESDQALEAAQASHARAVASVAGAQAQSRSASASLMAARSDLAKAVVKSPITGIVLERTVEPGQTVTSGLQTPVLFKLATDLKSMRLEVAIDEADVGKVREGQRATFKVDAFPNKTFESKVLAVKNLPTEGASVVTYEAWLEVDNTERLLRPGMTATATVVVEQVEGALLVPNAALRFRPPSGEKEPKAGAGVAAIMKPRVRGGGSKRRGGARPTDSARGGGAKPSGSAGGRDEKTGGGPIRKGLFVLEGHELKRVRVNVGVTDGTRTQILGSDLKEGAPVVINLAETKSD